MATMSLLRLLTCASATAFATAHDLRGGTTITGYDESLERDLQVGGPCYICGSSDKSVGSPNTQLNFNDIWGDPVSTTCGTLESEAEDAYPDIWLHHNLCQAYIYQAKQHCDCPGSDNDAVVNANDGCDICGSGMSVPANKENQIVDSGVIGFINCGFLVEAALDGFIPSTLCSDVISSVQGSCCEAIGGGDSSTTSTTTDQTTNGVDNGASSQAVDAQSVRNLLFWSFAGAAALYL